MLMVPLAFSPQTDTHHQQQRKSFPRQNSLSPPLGVSQPSISHRRSSDTTIGIDIGDEDLAFQRQNIPKPSLLTLTAPRQVRNILSESLHQGSSQRRTREEDVIMTSASSNNTTGTYPNNVP